MPRVIAIAVILCAGCRPVQLAGESLGEFRVTGTLEENTCASGYPVPQTFTFLVELRREPMTSTGYWRLPDRPATTGAVHDDGAFRFEQRTQVVAFEPDPSTGSPGCALDHTEVVAGSIDASDADGGPSGGLSGHTIIDVVPSPGTLCTPLLTLYGGTFPVLPCRVDYSLEGEPAPATM